jgi:hypothetical protein
MKRAYRFFLLLYPRDFRDRFADEMAGIFEEACRDRYDRGWAWQVRFTFAEMTGLIAGAAGAWFDRRPDSEDPAASTLPPELMEAQRRVDLNIAGMVHAIANHQFEKARVHSDEERQARENLRVLREKYGINT